jgi:hypothetical protein
LPKLPKHYHAAQWVHAYVFVCLWALCEEYMLGLLLILISKSWGWPPLGAWHAFPRPRHMRGGGLFIFVRFSCMMPSMDGCRDGWTSHMMKKFHEKRPQRPLLYVILTKMWDQMKTTFILSFERAKNFGVEGI